MYEWPGLSLRTLSNIILPVRGGLVRRRRKLNSQRGLDGFYAIVKGRAEQIGFIGGLIAKCETRGIGKAVAVHFVDVDIQVRDLAGRRKRAVRRHWRRVKAGHDVWGWRCNFR